MEEKSTSVWKSSLTPGLYLGIFLILISVVFYVTGNVFSKTAQYLGFPIMLVGVIWGQITYKKVLGGTMTYGQAVVAGLLTMVFASILTSVYTFILYKFVDPSLIEQLHLFTEEQMVLQGNVPEEQMEMALQWSTKFQTPLVMLVSGLFGGAFIGLIISLITAIFTKKNPSDEVPE